MLPKWVYPLLILFVVFFILSNPESAGPQARSFFGWIGDQASAAGTFLDGVFGDDVPATNSGTTTTTTTIQSGVTTDGDGFSTLRPIIVLEPAPV